MSVLGESNANGLEEFDSSGRSLLLQRYRFGRIVLVERQWLANMLRQSQVVLLEDFEPFVQLTKGLKSAEDYSLCCGGTSTGSLATRLPLLRKQSEQDLKRMLALSERLFIAAVGGRSLGCGTS